MWLEYEIPLRAHVSKSDTWALKELLYSFFVEGSGEGWGEGEFREWLGSGGRTYCLRVMRLSDLGLDCLGFRV